ncbi:LLM class flavin-dependent oxidoreductase [Microbacterium rhizomatis]|uniref:LLM class flavin-dependent oxidoreductase n=1 Tax=Microbacterium rhizomatis TaxID=1631477 RepID=A0A5J5J4E4_9MICO|nr:LLM class flavin-dependent oxidoreductase [Microbacterium rhizomatis]KAA9108203.1 LLM class flavin-dependent oxidoreductase [Microbacterium rhizomatis]
MVALTLKGEPVQIGLVDLFDGTPERGPEFIQAYAKTAEDRGFAGIWLPEHILFFDHYASAYPYPAAPSATDPTTAEVHNKVVDGTAQVEASADQGLLDLFQTAVYVCDATTTLRFGSSVMLLPLRNPKVIARELMTVSELTDDRFDLGVGVGWSSEELEACGTDFTTRGRRCEEMMIEMQKLWSDEAVYPAASRPFPRMLVGGHSPAAIRRAAQVATGWYPWNLTLPEFAHHYATYRRHLEAGSREVGEQKVIAGLRFSGDLEALPAIVNGYARLGADAVNISLRTDTATYADTLSAASRVLGLAA